MSGRQPSFVRVIGAEVDTRSVEQIEREAVLSALDELRAKVEQMEALLGRFDGGENFDSGFVGKAAVLALIDASGSALETPKS